LVAPERHSVIAWKKQSGGRIYRFIEQFDSILKKVSVTLKARTEVVEFEKMSMRKQMEAARDATVFLTTTGAGSHISLFMPRSSTVVRFYGRKDKHLEKHLFSQIAHAYTENVQTDGDSFDEAEVMAIIRSAFHRYDSLSVAKRLHGEADLAVNDRSRTLKTTLTKPAPKIPRFLYQSWITRGKKMPEKMQRNIALWDKSNPKLDHRFFDDAEQQRWMKVHFVEAFPAWQSMKLPAARADLFRYCLLYRYGGVWSDVDITPHTDIFQHIDLRAELVVVHDGGMGEKYLYNAFIAAKRGHPVLRKAIDIVLDHYQQRLQTRAVDCTGPGVLWRALDEVQKAEPMTFEGFSPSSNTHYLIFRGNSISHKITKLMDAKYDGYLDDASTNGGEPHYGREVTWSD